MIGSTFHPSTPNTNAKIAPFFVVLGVFIQIPPINARTPKTINKIPVKIPSPVTNPGRRAPTVPNNVVHAALQKQVITPQKIPKIPPINANQYPGIEFAILLTSFHSPIKIF